MDEDLQRPQTEEDELLAGYESLGVVALQILTLPVWLPVWLYIRLVHRRPSRCIRERFRKDRPDDELLAIHIERKLGPKVWGRLTDRSGTEKTFEYYRDLDHLTIYER